MEKKGLLHQLRLYMAYRVTKALYAGEVKNPTRNLPLSMIFSLFLITIVYTTISYFVGNVSLQILKNDYKPIHTLTTNLSGEWLNNYSHYWSTYAYIYANSGF